MQNPVSAEPDIDSEDIVRALLEETRTNEPPTNAERIARQLGLVVRGFSHGEFKLDAKIRAFLWPAQNMIGVDRKLTYKRRTYSILHEVGHYVLPGHIATRSEDIKIVDEDRTLSAATVITQEIQANQFAADCLFQLDRFNEYISNQLLLWGNIRKTADTFNASFEATARRWVEKSNELCALVVMNPSSSETGAPLAIMYTVTSPLFANEYFKKLAPGQAVSTATLAHRVFHKLEYHDNPVEDFQIEIAGETHIFPTKLFTNGYRLFGLITETRN